MVMPLYGEILDYRYRLVNYVGGGVMLSAPFGSAFHFIRGLRNAPSGGHLAGGVHAVRTNVPPLAGRCGSFLAAFWAVESAVGLARGRREDHWNSIVAGATTCGLSNARKGARATMLWALLGAPSFAGVAGFWWTMELWHSTIVQHYRREAQMNHSSPADPIVVGSVEFRSEGHDLILYGPGCMHEGVVITPKPLYD